MTSAEKADYKKAAKLTDHVCPFCGRGDTSRFRAGEYDRYWVGCNHCHARGPEADTLTWAVEAWNVKLTSPWQEV